MSLRRARPPHPGRTRRGLRTTALAVTAVAALTASQAPGLTGEAKDAHAAPAADEEHRPAADAPHAPYVEPAPPGDGSYHTELPPLTSQAGTASPAVVRGLRSQSGIPVTVLRAYRAAETSVGRTDPGCRLPWQLLAAIGKVESGHAGGGAVTQDGTTVRRITGPALDGRGFALIRDTEGGAHDGDRVYDRAVGPMQFLPSTWSRWGADGNGDGRADPNNVFDAALAAGHYLCAGDRDLGRGADLDGAVLSYNHSRPYLELVRYWLEFYSRGVHPVPDGTGVVPRSPGAGGDTPAAEPADGADGGGAGGGDGIIVGPDPTPPDSPEPSPSAPSPRPTPAPTPASPSPSAPTTPRPGPTASESPGEQPTAGPSPSPSPDPTAEPSPSPTQPDDCATQPATPSPDPSPSPSPSPCPTVTTG
ncbi:lytic transglycosylase domain-containing protein [Streptomyces pharetrae]|uniref:lytic transglycosylase domain-containing protein n=1 Tax=Streptomyces pharetrae TaxID=291370 RepID=UPI00335AC268